MVIIFTNFYVFTRYYPFHYAPYVSDIKDFQDHPFVFEMGKPFLPFEQLLAVLPAASKELLPEPFRNLMIMEQSPIIEFYPVDFETDLNGKKQDWEAVVLIPFIDEVGLTTFKSSRFTSDDVAFRTFSNIYQETK